LPIVSTSEFDDYLASIPPIRRLTKKTKSHSSSSLKPELLKRCFEIVEKEFFDENYKIDDSWFDKRTKNNIQRQQNMQ